MHFSKQAQHRTQVKGMLILLSSAVASQQFALSAVFTDDMVLQMAPQRAAIYGVASPGASVTVTVMDDSGVVDLREVTASPAAAGGTTDPLCQQRCIAAGHCATGQISACQRPSCAIGCTIAGRTATASGCKHQCSLAESPASGCTYSVGSPAGPYHEAGVTTFNSSSPALPCSRTHHIFFYRF